MLNMQQPSHSDRQAVSELVDGELTGAALAQACGAWRDDPEARAQWHAYHLIGDVLRSDDLASTAKRDAAFLAALRGRLADEPVPLAPQPLLSNAPAPQGALVSGDGAGAVAPRRRGQWLVAPAAVAAGFVAVAAVLVLVRGPGASADAPVLASAGVPTATPATTTTTAGITGPRLLDTLRCALR